MSEPVTREDFRVEMKDFRQEVRDSQLDLRTQVLAAMLKMSDTLETHKEEDRQVERRVTIIEVERDGEKRDVAKRATMIGGAVAAATTGLVELVKQHFK